MGYKLKQWIIEDSRTSQIDKALIRSRRAREELEERLGKQTIPWG